MSVYCYPQDGNTAIKNRINGGGKDWGGVGKSKVKEIKVEMEVIIN